MLKMGIREVVVTIDGLHTYLANRAKLRRIHGLMGGTIHSPYLSIYVSHSAGSQIREMKRK